jgi:hypothetical protein
VKPDDLFDDVPIVPKKHFVTTTYDVQEDRWYWQCSCGPGGSVPGWSDDVSIVSDEHIDYVAKEKRIDRHSARDVPDYSTELKQIQYDRYGYYF